MSDFAATLRADRNDGKGLDLSAERVAQIVSLAEAVGRHKEARERAMTAFSQYGSQLPEEVDARLTLELRETCDAMFAALAALEAPRA